MAKRPAETQPQSQTAPPPPASNLEREVGELLGIPDTVTQVALLPVAYYTGDTFQPAKRRPIEQLTYWDTWKHTLEF